MKTHRSEFQRLAGEKESEGDPEFKELMREMQERDDLKGELGDQAGTSGTRAAVPQHAHEPEAKTSHDGHTPKQFTKIAKREGETPVGGISESAQQDTTTKHHDAHEGGSHGRDVSQQGVASQQGVVPQQGAYLQQGQSLPADDQPLQEGEILQDHPYLKYYIHDLDHPAEPISTFPTGQAPGVQTSQLDSPTTQGTSFAGDRLYEQRSAPLGQHATQHDQGAQYMQENQYASDRPSEQASTQYGQQGAGYEREGGPQHQHGRRTQDGTEIGETSQDRSMGRQSGAAETARAQAMLANTDGPSDRGTPGPFTGA